MNRAILLNTPELLCPGTHYFHTTKFLSSFSLHGYTALEVRSLQDFVSMSPDAGDIVYVSNHGVEQQHTTEAAYLALELISRFECVYLLWFFHFILSDPRMPSLKRWILTGEHFRKEPAVLDHKKCWDMQQTMQNYHPLTFAAAFHPDDVGRFSRNEKLEASFVGHPYQQQWCSRLHSERNVLIRYTPPFITEQERLSIYLSSVVALGFHSDNNRLNSVLVERVFEGLALGNVVVSDNPCCEEITDGIVKFVDSYESVTEVLQKCWTDVNERKKLQLAGTQWCKNNGTYYTVSKSFIEKSHTV